MYSYSEKDWRYIGQYTFGFNRFKAKNQNGNMIGIIFDPTPPHLISKEMQELIVWDTWAIKDRFKYPLIMMANFIFEYLVIYPFQDNNGNISRLISNLLL